MATMQKGPRQADKAPVADPEAREFLRKADPVMAPVQRAYALDHPPTEHEMDELAERWRPYRSLAVAYLFASEYEV